MKAEILKTDGTSQEVKPEMEETFTLAELQRFVGGYIEIHRMPDGKLMVMNENAMSLNLPLNDLATVTAYNLNTGAGIRGNVLLCDECFLD